MSRLYIAAGLLRAIADAVGVIRLGAKAGGVTLSTLELGLGNGSHVANTELSAGSESRLGRGSASNGGEDSEGLHLHGRDCLELGAR